MGGYIGSKGVGIISGIDASIADLNLTDKAAANGVTEANKVLTADANKDVTAIRNLSATGNLVATVDVTAGGAITATGTVTRALTRGSIDVGNSSGVSSALAKGAAGTVLTSDGTDLSFVAASGGGEQEFTATGAITAGQPVGITTTGTISTSIANQSGLLDGGSSTTVTAGRFDYDTNANKLVICTRGGGGTQIMVEIATPSANLTASFGTPVVSRSANTREGIPAFDPATGRTNILYVASSSNPAWLYAVSGIISGTSMTFGSEATGTNNDAGDIVTPTFINAGANKSVAITKQYFSGSAQGIVYVLTTSGTSISFGTPVILDSQNFNTAGRNGAVYDSNAGKVVIFYQYPNQASYAKVGTISGSTISLGSRVTISSSTFMMQNSQVYPCFDTNSNKVVLATANSITGKPSVIVGTVSGTSISFGAPVVINEAAANASGMYAAFDSSTNTVSISYYTSSGDVGHWLQKVKVNGTSVDVGPKISLSGNAVYGPTRYADDIDRTIVLQQDSGGSFAITNTNAPTYVGLAKENIADGDTGKVTVAGGINESQSNLITGFPYGLAPTSSTIAAGPANQIGTALSATKIYLSKGSL